MQQIKLFSLLFLLLFFHAGSAFAQPTTYLPYHDTLEGDAFIRVVDQSLTMYYEEHLANNSTDSIIAALGYEEGDVPVFSDDVYCERLAKMNNISTFGFECNNVTLATIRSFASSRRNFARIILGRSRIYFPMFEEKLAEHGLPIELKYLSVIESGLRPQIKSHAGACGLWQFMYSTGKSYGLTENSYIDERMDPVKATEAACMMLKKLYKIYGDWNLALAAYNAGPGNVNKAIKRSGGKRTYWEIRPFLPRETQAYVPTFIAAAYLLHYHHEHNVVPAEPKYYDYQLDTMCLSQGMHMQTITSLTGWTVEDIQFLNPVYKATYIPPTTPRQCITGPLDKIGLLVTIEDSLYAMERKVYGQALSPQTAPTITVITPPVPRGDDQLVVSNPTKDIPATKVVNTIQYTYHRVKSGESLGSIAADYKVTVPEVIDWNKLTSNRITIGQMLKIQTKVTTTIANPEFLENVEKQISDSLENVTPKAVEPPKEIPGTKKYYTIRSGDSFAKIASRNHVSVTTLRKLNPGVNPSRIRAGQRLRVK